VFYSTTKYGCYFYLPSKIYGKRASALVIKFISTRTRTYNLLRDKTRVQMFYFLTTRHTHALCLGIYDQRRK